MKATTHGNAMRFASPLSRRALATDLSLTIEYTDWFYLVLLASTDWFFSNITINRLPTDIKNVADKE